MSGGAFADEPDDETTIPWFADDFETTTDLDGPIGPWKLSDDEVAECAELAPGETRLKVQSRTKKHDLRTITYSRDLDGTLTATYRTGRVRVWAWAIAPLDDDIIYTGQVRACRLVLTARNTTAGALTFFWRVDLN